MQHPNGVANTWSSTTASKIKKIIITKIKIITISTFSFYLYSFILVLLQCILLTIKNTMLT